MEPFAEPSDVAAIWRPLSTAEATIAQGLLVQASNSLRVLVPGVDEKIAADASGLKAALAKAAVANAVKRVLQNPEGWLSEDLSIDDFSRTKRRDSALSTSLLYIDRNDLIGLAPARSKKFRMINLRSTI